MIPIHLGCIADDFTGATDLANNLVRAGMRVLQTQGVPTAQALAQMDLQVDAIVVALKSRTIPADQAVAQSLQALRWLQERGAKQFYFKYCSTFDSTPAGNIGPVADALMQALGTDFTVATPAFPDNHRTVFKGYLYVGDVLLSESGMRNHPLTPMTDPNLVRVLQAQTHSKVGLVDYRSVSQGADAVRARIGELRQAGVRMAVVDALSNEDLVRMGPALADLPLLTGGSGLAIGLPANFGIQPSSQAAALPPAQGRRAIVSGSCSEATNRQVAEFIAAGGQALALDPLRMAEGEGVVAQALAWAQQHLDRQPQQPVLIYSTAPPDAVKAIQARLGVEAAGHLVENTLAQIACGLVAGGVQQLIVAGGETSGACVLALDLAHLRIGGQIDPGVPWCHSVSAQAPHGLHIALKSGNFGTPDFFGKAWQALAT
ncbi:3-oxo-tetronate kinase [Amphibiibacter pelophylacis]|uniref:Four-carbon acid sugar kinase family protein n=1 Tax=Amphibiibacter pelophylacis TaxID=1799477 RepID=A0ACC6NYS8_9BURK